MRSICIIDTSIFVEILKVPVKSKKHDQIIKKLEQKINDEESLFLPMTTIFETGNHIAQNGDGNQRWPCAKRFVEEVKKAINNQSPFQPIRPYANEEIGKWIEEFPDSALKEIGLSDLSIIKDYERICSQNQGKEVYIWSLDTHLQGYKHIPKL